MTHIITSDLHLGSRFCRHEAFLAFLDQIPPSATLVLNGDIVDLWQDLQPVHLAILDRLRALSREQPVVWIRGNHDRDFVLDDPAGIRFTANYAIDDTIFVVHGDTYADSMPGHRVAKQIYSVFHNLRKLLGMKPIHVAFYARHASLLYTIFRRHVRTQAAAYARRHGYETVICGHTHQIEDTVIDGIRYLNTGSWTEAARGMVAVSEDKNVKLTTL